MYVVAANSVAGQWSYMVTPVLGKRHISIFTTRNVIVTFGDGGGGGGGVGVMTFLNANIDN